MLSPLASTADLADFLNQSEPSNVGHWQAHLGAASDVFRAKTNQQIEFVEDDEVELTGTWNHQLWLPQRPVIDITALAVRLAGSTTFTAMEVTDIPFTRRGMVAYPSASWIDGSPGGYWGSPTASIQVTYSHGYEEIPSDVISTVCSMAVRGMQNPSGLQSESIGTYSYAYPVGSTGSVGLTDQESAIIARYSWKVPR